MNRAVLGDPMWPIRKTYSLAFIVLIMPAVAATCFLFWRNCVCSDAQIEWQEFESGSLGDFEEPILFSFYSTSDPALIRTHKWVTTNGGRLACTHGIQTFLSMDMVVCTPEQRTVLEESFSNFDGSVGLGVFPSVKGKALWNSSQVTSTSEFDTLLWNSRRSPKKND